MTIFFSIKIRDKNRFFITKNDEFIKPNKTVMKKGNQGYWTMVKSVLIPGNAFLILRSAPTEKASI